MNPIYSYEDRYKIVMNFIACRGQGQIRIVDFTPLIRYFDDIRPLRQIKKTGLTPLYPDRNKTMVFPIHGQVPPIGYDPCISREDAEEYFNWLIMTLTADDKATEETRKEAVSQLFLFIFVLRDKIDIPLNDFLKAGFEWEKRIDSLDEAVKDLEGSMKYLDNRNDESHDNLREDIREETEKVSTVLERIGCWQKHYQPFLEALEKDHNRIGQVLQGDVSDKKRKP